MSQIKFLSGIYVLAALLLSANAQGQIIRPVEDHATLERGKVQQAVARDPGWEHSQVVSADGLQPMAANEPPIVTASSANPTSNSNLLAPISSIPPQTGSHLPPIVSGASTSDFSGTSLTPMTQPVTNAADQSNPLMPNTLEPMANASEAERQPAYADANVQPATAQWPAQTPQPPEMQMNSPMFHVAQEPPAPTQSYNPGMIQTSNTAGAPLPQNGIQRQPNGFQRPLTPYETPQSRFGNPYSQPGFEPSPGGTQLPPIVVGNSPSSPVVSGASSSHLIQETQIPEPAPVDASAPPVVQSGAAAEGPGGLTPQEPGMVDAGPNYLDNSNIQAPSVYDETSALNGGCQACGNPTCNGSCATANYMGCSNCGDSGCGDPGAVATRFGCSGSVTCARRYVQLEALGWKFEDTNFSGTNAGGLGEYDVELGWRATIGRRFDATAGDEISYLGGMWDKSRTITDPSGRLSAQFLVGIPFVPANFSTFTSAFVQTEMRESDLHSIEYNRVKWGWDVVKTFWGIRGTYLRDEYSLFTNDGFGTGLMEVEAQNFLIGPQWGGKLFYDVGYRTSYSVGLKLGAAANFMNLDTMVTNAGTTFVDNESDSTNFSGHLELNGFAHYQLTPQARLRFGYNLLILWKMATATDNYPFILDSNAGGSIRDSEDLYFHGLSGGIEIFR